MPSLPFYIGCVRADDHRLWVTVLLMAVSKIKKGKQVRTKIAIAKQRRHSGTGVKLAKPGETKVQATKAKGVVANGRMYR